MGRGLLIMTLGMTIIMGMIQVGVQNRQLSTVGLNVGYFNQTFANNIAGSSLEVGINRFSDENNWRTEGDPWIYTISGEESEIHVDDYDSHPDELNQNQIRIRVLAEVDNRTARSEAILEFESIFPPIPGAMGFYGDDLEDALDIRGNVSVDGRDKNPDGTEGAGPDLPGIVAGVEQEVLVDQSGNAAELEGDPPYSVEELDGEELQAYIEDYMAVASEYVAPDVGSVENPKIIKLPEGNTKISDNTTGAGVLIVPYGSTLELRGDFKFQGLLIVEGTLDIAGNVEIYGSALFSDNAHVEIDDPDSGDAALKGNAMVQYSGSALLNVDRALGAAMNRGFFISSIFE